MPWARTSRVANLSPRASPCHSGRGLGVDAMPTTPKASSQAQDAMARPRGRHGSSWLDRWTPSLDADSRWRDGTTKDR